MKRDGIQKKQSEGRFDRNFEEIMVPVEAVGEASIKGSDMGRHSVDGGEPGAGGALRVAPEAGKASGSDCEFHSNAGRARPGWESDWVRRRYSQCHLRPCSPLGSAGSTGTSVFGLLLLRMLCVWLLGKWREGKKEVEFRILCLCCFFLFGKWKGKGMILKGGRMIFVALVF